MKEKPTSVRTTQRRIAAEPGADQIPKGAVQKTKTIAAVRQAAHVNANLPSIYVLRPTA